MMQKYSFLSTATKEIQKKLFSTKHYGLKEFHVCNMLLFLHDVIKYNRPMMTLLKNSKFHSTYKSLD